MPANTVTCDVNALVAAGLLRRFRGGVTANRDVIKAFLPVMTTDGHV